MELNKHIVPDNICEAFKDVNLYEEVKKFFLHYQQLGYYPNVNLLHFSDSNLRKMIDIDEHKMLIGEIVNLNHSESDFKIYNPCIEFFTEMIWGSLFDNDLIKLESFKCTAITFEDADNTKRLTRRVTKYNLNCDDKSISLYELSWTMGQGGDPFYYVIDVDDLKIICNYLTHGYKFEEYISLRIMEYLYESKVLNVGWHSIPNVESYIQHIIDNRHNGDLPWFEV